MFFFLLMSSSVSMVEKHLIKNSQPYTDWCLTSGWCCWSSKYKITSPVFHQKYCLFFHYVTITGQIKFKFLYFKHLKPHKIEWIAYCFLNFKEHWIGQFLSFSQLVIIYNVMDYLLFHINYLTNVLLLTLILF